MHKSWERGYKMVLPDPNPFSAPLGRREWPQPKVQLQANVISLLVWFD